MLHAIIAKEVISQCNPEVELFDSRLLEVALVSRELRLRVEVDMRHGLKIDRAL
jgi:hypothetical protein